MFASKTPRDLNSDPHPYRYANGDRRVAPEVDPDDPTTYAPRPEYDHPQHNEPNPILVAYRKDRDDDGPAALGWWLSELDPENVKNPDWETWPVIFDATDDQRDHARRVLTHLAVYAPKEQA